MEKKISMHKKQIDRFIGVAIFALIAVTLGVSLQFKNGKLYRPRYIFIDGGAHLGETILHLEKSKLYSKHHWEIFSFEANPNLIPYIPKRPNVVVLSKAIWIDDNGIDFYLAKHTESSSILKNKKTGELSKIPIRVESVDFGQWLKRNFNQKDFILVKFDIEGAEYEVLNKMLLDGTIRFIDELYIEFHNTRVDIPKQRDTELMAEIRKFGIPVKDSPESEEFGDWFKK